MLDAPQEPRLFPFPVPSDTILLRQGIAAGRHLTLLLIGFEVAGQKENASTTLISESLGRLEPDRNRVAAEYLRIEKGSIDDMHQRQTQQLVQLIFEHRPETLLFVGQAAGRNSMMLERLAINFFADQRVVEEAPAAYWQTLPGLESLASEAQAESIALSISNFAGYQTSNHALYSALHLASTEKLPFNAGLLHVPLLESQCVEEMKGQPNISLEDACQCLCWLVERLAPKMP